MLCVDAVPAGVPAPWAAVWALRWLTFRIMLGAGMIKIRGDSCWRDLTAMVYHYQTQPVPNPLSWFLHHSPVSRAPLPALMWWQPPLYSRASGMGKGRRGGGTILPP
jgi:hypothetical protein